MGFGTLGAQMVAKGVFTNVKIEKSLPCQIRLENVG